MCKKLLPGILLFQIGALIAIISAIADLVGLGGPYLMYGPKQIAGTGLGIVLGLIGLRDILRKNKWTLFPSHTPLCRRNRPPHTG